MNHLAKALETNESQTPKFDRKKRLIEIEFKLKHELLLTDGEVFGLKSERLRLLKELLQEKHNLPKNA